MDVTHTGEFWLLPTQERHSVSLTLKLHEPRGLKYFGIWIEIYIGDGYYLINRRKYLLEDLIAQFKKKMKG